MKLKINLIKGRKLFSNLLFILAIQITASAATYTVTNTNDSGAGSLRGAIATANGTTADDTIDFAIPSTDANCTSGVCTVKLTSGEIVFNSSSTAGALTITNATGGGAASLAISGNNQSRVFYLNSGVNVTLNGVTVKGGNGTGTTDPSEDGTGGGILILGGTLTVTNSSISGNSALKSSGGILNYFATITITNSVISGNSGTQFYAGGIRNYGTVIMTNSTVSGNSAPNSGGGILNQGIMTITNSTISGNSGSGGIYNNGASGSTTLTLTSSTISGNSGTGIYNSIGNTLTMTNSTVSGNSGGGISNSGTLNATNSTIVGNSGVGFGGGISHGGSNSTVNIRNTIIAGNTSTADNPDIYYGLNGSSIFQSNGNNLIGNTNTGRAITWQASDILNQSPRLASLGNYGGATKTMLPNASSPAINTGNNCVLTVGGCGANDPPTALTTDQRGFSRNGQVDIGAVERLGVETFKIPLDFDGDGKTDIGIFRPSNGQWWINRSSSGQTFATQFGQFDDKIVPADYTGDGKADIAIFQPSFGDWYILRSENSSYYALPFGISTDIPAPGDYDGDGKVDVAVFRPSALTWYINKSSGGTDIVGFGTNGDKPVIGDYDGDGKADIAIFRPNGAIGAEWWIRKSSNNQVFAATFGTSTDKPVQGDFTGDGKADLAFWRPSNGNWYILRSEDFSFYAFPFGASTDIPVAGDYDGDGKTDAGVFRPSNNTWYINRSTAGTLIQQFGISGDSPIPSAFVP